MKSLIKKNYIYLCRVYSFIFTLIEEKFFKENNTDISLLDKEGYFKIDKNSNLDISNKKLDFIFLGRNKIISKDYQELIILNKEKLDLLINILFEKQFCSFLTSLTGYKYSIDFICVYQNFYIPKENRNKAFYASHYHLDKPNSKNMLKIFIPIDYVDLDNGPLEILNIQETKRYLSSKKNVDDAKLIFFTGSPGDLYLCKLNMCLHRAGIPKKGKTTKLIMIQLNPSDKWYVNSKIYKRQSKIEPKFNSFINNFLIREKLLFSN